MDFSRGTISPSRIGCYRRYCHTWERDQQKLLETVRDWTVPAEAVLPLLAAHGYQPSSEFLARTRWAEVDHDRQVVRVTRDMRQRMHTPSVEKEFLAATLAHELAHVVLHQGKRRQRCHEDEAWVWGTLFLMPWWLLARRPEIRALDGDLITEKQRWAKIYSLAEWLRVSASNARHALELYGLTVPNPNSARSA